ncbi:MAG: hypothetical protein H8E76_06830 [Helicobacteraceae bacterium]|nr:hypothetical protein [Candidatus Sulfurimonas ponti]MBL6974077.1 hypothetical protein [Sulfurimonas sp.]
MNTYPDQWTQEEFLKNKIKLAKEGIEVFLIDTILSPIDKANTLVYNPHELKNLPEGSVFVFYCDSGKATLDRLKEYKAKFPDKHCISLKSGRGYWRKNMMILDTEEDNNDNN